MGGKKISGLRKRWSDALIEDLRKKRNERFGGARQNTEKRGTPLSLSYAC